MIHKVGEQFKHAIKLGVPMIAILNYGVGNLGSIVNMLRKLGEDSYIASTPSELARSRKIILPGVGAFDTGMQKLESSGMLTVLNKKALIEKVPILGICLGAQLMTRSSEEGELGGLAWFEADTVKFNFSNLNKKLPLPSIGWRETHDSKRTTLLNGMSEMPRFYYVHSYYLKPDSSDIISMTAEYGEPFAAGLSCGNLHCVQFHPEKSHKFGMQFFRNFIAMK